MLEKYLDKKVAEFAKGYLLKNARELGFLSRGNTPNFINN